MRAVREQTAVGSSLFAQPLMLAPVPIDDGTVQEPASAQTPEDHARAALDELTALTTTPAPLDELCDTLSLFRRWYYRPEKQRTGEVFLPNAFQQPPAAGDGGYDTAFMNYYAATHGYTLAAAWGADQCNLHLYWLRPGFPDYATVLSDIRDHP